MESLLESAGYQVRLYLTAEAFLEQSGFAQIDCLVSDVVLPAMGGEALQRMARTLRPGLPVILMTGCDLSDEAMKNICAEQPFFRKPFSGEALLAAMAKVLPPTPNRKT
jgi:FixJ family two-component response regulator